jgi:hypothetical protein
MTNSQILLDALINTPPRATIDLRTLASYADDLGDRHTARRLQALITHVHTKPALDTIPDRHLQCLVNSYRSLITTLAILIRVGIIDPARDLANEHELHITAINLRERQLAETDNT